MPTATDEFGIDFEFVCIYRFSSIFILVQSIWIFRRRQQLSKVFIPPPSKSTGFSFAIFLLQFWKILFLRNSFAAGILGMQHHALVNLNRQKVLKSLHRQIQFIFRMKFNLTVRVMYFARITNTAQHIHTRTQLSSHHFYYCAKKESKHVTRTVLPDFKSIAAAKNRFDGRCFRSGITLVVAAVEIHRPDANIHYFEHQYRRYHDSTIAAPNPFDEVILNRKAKLSKFSIINVRNVVWTSAGADWGLIEMTQICKLIACSRQWMLPMPKQSWRWVPIIYLYIIHFIVIDKRCDTIQTDQIEHSIFRMPHAAHRWGSSIRIMKTKSVGCRII